MASGSFNKYLVGENYNLVVDWYSTGNEKTNSSVVVVGITLYCPTPLYISGRTGDTCSCTINGKVYPFDTPAVYTDGGTSHPLATITSDAIQHNADGSKNVDISVSWNLNAVVEGVWYGIQTVSSSVKLDTLPRASTVTMPITEVGQTATVTINRAFPSFTHTLSYVFGTLSGIICEKTEEGTLSWAIPTDFYSQMTTTPVETGTITCYTYNGDALVGTTTNFFTVNVPNDSAPVISPVANDVNPATLALTGDSTRFVRFHSDAQVAVNATPKYGATITEYKVMNGGKTNVTAETGLFEDVMSAVFGFSVTDSRGYTTSQTVNHTLVAYTHATCNLKVSMTPDGVITGKINGNFFSGSFGAVTNSLSVQLRCKPQGGDYSEWVDATYTTNRDTYNSTGVLDNLDYRLTYTVQARVVDKLESVLSTEQVINCIPVFDWNKSDFHFNVPVEVEGGVTATGNVSGGNVTATGDVTATGNVSATGDLSASGTLSVTGDATLGQTSISSLVASGTGTFGGKVTLNGGWFTDAKVLSSQTSSLGNGHTVNLSEPISQQANGIVLVFSQFNVSTGSAIDAGWNTFFVSKYVVSNFPGQGHVFIMTTDSVFGTIGAKYVWIADDVIAGQANNITSGSNNSVYFDNTAFVLRYVLGV